MPSPLDATHDPHLQSWVASANLPDTDFPIQNLPFGIFQRSRSQPRIGIAIGDYIVDLSVCIQNGVLTDLPEAIKVACMATHLNPLMGLGQRAITTLRHQLSHLLEVATPPPDQEILVPMAEVHMLLPAQIGNYTDFYASIHHATNVGQLFRPDHPLLPNYKHIPIAYHGRASSIVVSHTPIHRPQGQQRPAASGEFPSFRPSQRLDYEGEVGLLVGRGNALGEPIPIHQAEEHLFGLCLVNDWSARDIQAWEYQPLGPFLGKSFATSLSPWVIPMAALAPFRCSPLQRSVDDPEPLPYLTENNNLSGINLTIEVWLSSAQMSQENISPIRLSQASFAQLYWTAAQMITHHTSNGCNLQPGDLLASGTVSGPTSETWGSLLEITHQGTTPIQLPTGEQRSFLADGDEVILRGYCESPNYRKIGFGDCRGKILSR
ncbi:fumarylacetoacetase [Leptothoe spongobia]|uniref:fumarylacetoacetase n=1 Tax=Leptothoe spongobia TAU-MAC 1115 TaxID=1967444 RepID=A0A947DD78_9CYAN|nr:fumarylacetoacetase [Leptothoe spongobia]MBT9314822.1 fumarylacetoacetase [Leptothoe spongobia TAU-MAC 1115]